MAKAGGLNLDDAAALAAAGAESDGVTVSWRWLKQMVRERPDAAAAHDRDALTVSRGWLKQVVADLAATRAATDAPQLEARAA